MRKRGIVRFGRFAELTIASTAGMPRCLLRPDQGGAIENELSVTCDFIRRGSLHGCVPSDCARRLRAGSTGNGRLPGLRSASRNCRPWTVDGWGRFSSAAQPNIRDLQPQQRIERTLLTCGPRHPKSALLTHVIFAIRPFARCSVCSRRNSHVRLSALRHPRDVGGPPPRGTGTPV
jgi:hypothetical protein